MSKVRLLPEDTSRKLAAGEVIIRPASAVKELIENSLDAGATRVVIELKSGGRDLIKITDDGTGMDRDDLRLAVHRHATSKLNEIDDLKKLRTFGFRGEALSSIATVSRLRVETATEHSTVGTFLLVEAGEVKEVGDIARAHGTTVTVNTLFFNLPVRRGFLKSDKYETRLVLDVVKQYALMFLDVHFGLRSDGEEILVVPKSATLKDRLTLFADAETAENLVEFKIENPMLTMSGCLLNPFSASRSYALQQIFINRRPVRNRAIVRAIYDGYGASLRGGNPSFLIMIETAPDKVDVNIHPTKQEVRFVDERFLYDFVSEAVRKTLGIQRSEEIPAREVMFESSFLSGGPEAQAFWQLHGSFIFAQVQSGYCIIDQHAAHERILYEEVMKRTDRSPEQGLLFPLTVELTPEEFAVYEETRESLATLGIQSKPFSGRTIVVEALPAGTSMTRDEIRDVFTDLAKLEKRSLHVREKLAEMVACKGAVKAGQRLTQTEMESLINRLFSCQNPFFCPHGRPAIIRITVDDLYKRFGRT
jgi:DNA mismatch repair protein MutL